VDGSPLDILLDAIAISSSDLVPGTAAIGCRRQSMNPRSKFLVDALHHRPAADYAPNLYPTANGQPSTLSLSFSSE